MAHLLPLRAACEQTSLSYYGLRRGCLEGRFPFVRAGSRFLVDPVQIRDCLAAEALENQARQRAMHEEVTERAQLY